jgi:hypothetical protein
MSDWGSVQARAPWAGVPLDAVRLPALRHLDLHRYCSSTWEQHGAAHTRGAARLVAAHAASLRILRLRFRITPHLEARSEVATAALEEGFLESVLLAAPLPALQGLDLGVRGPAADEARWLEALRPLERLSLPRIARLDVGAGAATGQVVRLLEGAHLPTLRHLRVDDYSSFRDHPCVAALTAPRWSALEGLELFVSGTRGDGMAALSTALAPTLRRLSMNWWPFGAEGCAEEWPQLRSLELQTSDELTTSLGPVRLPRLERLALVGRNSLRGFAARRAALPALRVMELGQCFCDKDGCPVAGCSEPESALLLAELQAAWPGLELRQRRRRPEDWTQA